MQISGENNLLLENIDVFNQVCEVGSTDEVSFVILMDGMHIEGALAAEYKYLNNPELDFPSLYLIRKGDNYESAKAEMIFKERDNLADKANLTTILTYIQNEHKAENYGYIYKGHGGAGHGDIQDGNFISKVVKLEDGDYTSDGSIDKEKIEARLTEKIMLENDGTRLDSIMILEQSADHPLSVLAIYVKEDTTILSYSGISHVLSDVFEHNGLAFIMLDCCWGMMIENVFTFSSNTQYFIASADESPALGIGYVDFCRFVIRRAKIKPDELAKLLVAVYYTIRYEDYDQPLVPEFQNMGVSFTCADTNFISELIIPNLTRFCSEVIKDMDGFVNVLLPAITTCEDYTYADPLRFKVFNIDLIWFLENIIFQIGMSEKKFDTIGQLAFFLIRDIKIYLITGYLGNNYKKTTLGVPALGGRGITITFPKNQDHAINSILENPEIIPEFYKVTKWKEMLMGFYEALDKKERNASQELRNIPAIEALSNIKGHNNFGLTQLPDALLKGLTEKSVYANWYEDYSNLNKQVKLHEADLKSVLGDLADEQIFFSNSAGDPFAVKLKPSWVKLK